MSGVQIHVAFDVLAWLAAGLAALWLSRMERIPFPAVTTDMSYLATLMLGAAAGAYVFGSINLWLSGQHGIGRSIEGAVFGGIAAIEVYKRVAGIRVRTGARFALPFAIGVAVGRIGCFLAGIEDFTHGTPTSVPWAHDFGDGVPRHPVQLYESAAMAAFAIVYLLCLRLRVNYVVDNGFPLAVGYYAAQRFLWEFLKPYGTLAGPFTLFHLLSLALFAYAVAMLATAPTTRLNDERAAA
jgi:phosphatidylglycerol---prolipoprotein diacylglyceryl transferase